MKLIIVLAFLALFCLACKHRGGKKILLRLSYNLGEKTDVKYRTYVITGNEQDDPVTNQYVRMGLRVDSVKNDSLYVLSAKYDYVRVKNGGMLGGEAYSSDREKTEMSGVERQMDQELRPILDSTYKLTINKRGQVIKPLSFLGGKNIPQGYSLIDYENFQIAFPADSVAIGDEWTNEKNVTIPRGKRTSTYYIESIYNSIIQIKVSGRLTSGTGPAKEFSGLYLINEKTNQLISMKIELEEKVPMQGKVKAVVSIEAH